MLRIFDQLGILSPHDVSRHPWSWLEISREEAVAEGAFGRVVVTFRSGSQECADQFTPNHPFYRGAGSHSLRGVRYYRYIDEISLPSFGNVKRPGELDGDAIAPIPPKKAPAQQKTWIEIELLDDKGDPVANEPYKIQLPDGTTQEGSLNSRGRARLEGIEPGSCEVTFPNIDAQDWQAAEA